MRTIHRDIVGAFIFSKDNKLLLGKSIKGGVYPNCWIVPGGGVDEDESQSDALKREILEETGIDLSSAQIEKVEGMLTGQSRKTLRETNEQVVVQMRFYNYKVTLPQHSKKIALSTQDDFIEAGWFEIDDLPQLKLSPPTIATLQKMDLLGSSR